MGLDARKDVLQGTLKVVNGKVISTFESGWTGEDTNVYNAERRVTPADGDEWLMAVRRTCCNAYSRAILVEAPDEDEA